MRRMICSAVLVTVTALAAAASVQAGTAELRFDRQQALPPEPKGGSPGSIAVYHLIYTAAPVRRTT